MIANKAHKRHKSTSRLQLSSQNASAQHDARHCFVICASSWAQLTRTNTHICIHSSVDMNIHTYMYSVLRAKATELRHCMLENANCSISSLFEPHLITHRIVNVAVAHAQHLPRIHTHGLRQISVNFSVCYCRMLKEDGKKRKKKDKTKK